LAIGSAAFSATMSHADQVLEVREVAGLAIDPRCARSEQCAVSLTRRE
jgi:hypothetical protein